MFAPEKARNRPPPRRSPLPPPATTIGSHLSMSMRQKKRDGIKNRRRHAKEAQERIRYNLPFQVPAQPRIYLAKSKFGPKQAPRLGKAARKAVEDRPLTTIAHNSTVTHAGIPNPNYAADSDIPRYAAIRFHNCVPENEAERLLAQVKELKDMPFKTTAAHGDTFLQAWIGLWRKYSCAPFVSAGRMQKKPILDEGIKNLIRILDQSLAKAAAYLRDVDEPTYNRMRCSHSDIFRLALSGVDRHRAAGAHRAWFAEDPDRVLTSSYRLGGVGSMMAMSISTGAGTSYHYDEGDDGHFYSMILVLGTGGLLKLPETGYQLYVRPGDVVFFLANQQLHKLEIDSEIPNAVQTVFTLWTDKLAMQAAKPSQYNDFYIVEPDAEDETEER
ncbi:hypothetical protein BU25DRAFT_87477 [Macroventuria anomochaeta]|uniref:Uncharacterized protein n=1 Tax=Macroventuria anomochaeta TaxID=301207 RepID=A0ACB6SIP9_9PLEO|nr:uncharacterized protein BU25DRAFT_87477 [Macroventuria anomochaeta]KAF2633007.1 hypothetical protein BU25DRAFT_87477 [Macroventuria anomochaeta]